MSAFSRMVKFLMRSFRYFPCIHLGVTVSDVIFSLFSLHPLRRHRFWCDLFVNFLASISASPFLMWSFHYFHCIHLGVTVSDVIFSLFSLHPSRRHRFWCDLFVIFLASISASRFQMWSFRYFPCIHLGVTVSDVIFSLFSLHPPRRHRFWCDLFIIFLASISTSPFLMWSFHYFPCIHLGVTVSAVFNWVFLVNKWSYYFFIISLKPNIVHHTSPWVRLLLYRSCASVPQELFLCSRRWYLTFQATHSMQSSIILFVTLFSHPPSACKVESK